MAQYGSVVDELMHTAGVHSAIGGDVQVGQRLQGDVRPGLVPDEGGVRLQKLNDTGTDGTKSQQTNLDLFHIPSR